MLGARTRELFGLVPVAVMVTAGFTAVLISNGEAINDATLGYGAIFLGLCVLGHLFIRVRLPYADPYIYPLAALLSGVGIVMIYRIDQELARAQAQWFVVGLVFFCAAVVFLKDLSVLERYRYIIATGAIGLLMLPRLTGGVVNGAYLQVKLGPIEFQPAEFAKIALIIFIAAYLAENRDVMMTYSRRILGVTLPPLRYFGPVILIWVLAMLMLVFIRDLGTSVMFFGAFLAILYVATGRASYVLVGLAMFALGTYLFAGVVTHIESRVDTWLDPFAAAQLDREGGSYQIVQSMFAQADGGLFGVGFGESLINFAGTPVLPAAHTDLIYTVVVEELGLVGGVGLLLVYLVLVARGFKTALIADEVFAKLLAAGLTAVFALQVFVIVGGVTRVIPLTGVTLPFVSYGGSSIVANLGLVALLMAVSDAARRPPEARAHGGLVL